MTPQSRGPDRVVLLIVAAVFALLSTWLGSDAPEKSTGIKPASSVAPARAGV